MPPSYPGRIVLRWCDTCHSPVPARRCSCGTETREVPVTPRGMHAPHLLPECRISTGSVESISGPPSPLFRRGIGNILYGVDTGRIGCFICRSSDMALIHMIGKEYPGLRQDGIHRFPGMGAGTGTPAGTGPGGAEADPGGK